MKKQVTTSPIRTNSLCPANGHDWQETVSQTYRTCQRTGCRAAERLVHGSWVSTAHKSPARKSPQAVPVSALLWSTQQFDALTFPYPGYDAKLERYMEQQYHKAVTDEQHYRAKQRAQQGGAACS